MLKKYAGALVPLERIIHNDYSSESSSFTCLRLTLAITMGNSPHLSWFHNAQLRLAWVDKTLYEARIHYILYLARALPL